MADRLLLPVLLAAALLAACCAPATVGPAFGSDAGATAKGGSETAFRATLLEHAGDRALVALDGGAPVRLLLAGHPLPDGVGAGDTIYVRGLLLDDGSVRVTSASYRRSA